jgi:hypothetical protein
MGPADLTIDDPHVITMVEQIFEHIAPDGTLAPDPTRAAGRPQSNPGPTCRSLRSGHVRFVIFLGCGEQFAAMRQGGSATSLLEAQLDLGRVDPVPGSDA